MAKAPKTFFLDTEFIESGPHKPVELISIGIVADDGREFYAISSEFNPDDANDWVKAHVLPHLGDQPRQPLLEIAADLRAFCGSDKPEFWGYYADYDWVVVAQLFGRMVDLPEGWPMFCRDIKQMAVEWGNPKLPKQAGKEHNALDDARWNKQAYEFLVSKAAEYCIVGADSGAGMITSERLRQIKVEGWTPEHDDDHNAGELAAAAECYAAAAADQGAGVQPRTDTPLQWPFSADWWKPKDQISNLVRAGALIAAEIDRIKRQS